MCIVCEIKADLSASKATVERAQVIVEKVEVLAQGLASVLDVCVQASQRNNDAFTTEEAAVLLDAESLFLKAGDGLADALEAIIGTAVAAGAFVVVLRPADAAEDDSAPQTPPGTLH